jgi:hypothetical protein
LYIENNKINVLSVVDENEQVMGDKFPQERGGSKRGSVHVY